LDTRTEAAKDLQRAVRTRRKAEKRLCHAESDSDVRAAAVAFDLARDGEVKAVQRYDNSVVQSAAALGRCMCSPGVTAVECPEHGGGI
jgi:hypothetical protein